MGHTTFRIEKLALSSGGINPAVYPLLGDLRSAKETPQQLNTQPMAHAAAGMRAVVVAASLKGPSGTSAQSLLTCEHRLQVSQNYLSVFSVYSQDYHISVYLSISIGFQWFPTQPCDWGIPNFVRMPKRTASAKFWLQFWRGPPFAKQQQPWSTIISPALGDLPVCSWKQCETCKCETCCLQQIWIVTRSSCVTHDSDKMIRHVHWYPAFWSSYVKSQK